MAAAHRHHQSQTQITWTIFRWIETAADTKMKQDLSLSLHSRISLHEVSRNPESLTLMTKLASFGSSLLVTFE